MKTFAALSLVTCAVLFHTTRAAADEDNIFRARFVADATEEEIDAKACELAGATSIGGRARVLDVRIDDRRCSSVPNRADAIALTVHVDPRLDGRHDVVLQIDPPEDAPVEDVRVALTDVGLELRSRITGAPRPGSSARLAQPRVVNEKPEKKIYSRGLYSFGIAGLGMGGALMGAGALVGIGTAFASAVEDLGCGLKHIVSSSSSCSSDVSNGFIAAGVLLGGGAAFLLIGGVSMSIGGREVAKVSAYATPSGGGIRVAF